MSIELGDLKPETANTIRGRFHIFLTASILMFSIAGYNLGAAKGHLEPFWLEELLMVISGIFFVFSFVKFLRVQNALAMRSKENR